MKEAYVSLVEAAELEGVQYDSFKKKVYRNSERFLIKIDKSNNGGKERKLVAVSSLSKSAREAYKKQKQLIEMDANCEHTKQMERPWYVDIDLEWYIEKNKQSYFKAVELGNIIRQFLSYNEKNRTEFAEEFAQEYLGKSQRTLYRYTSAYLEASVWADKLGKKDGCDYEFFKVLCFCRKPKETGRFPSFTEEVKHVIKNIWFNQEFAKNNGTREMLYEELKKISELNGWEKIPSYQSVARYISYLMEEKGMYSTWILAREGTVGWRNKAMIKGSRDTKNLKVMEILMGDEHTFDCWVTYKNENGTVSPIRPKLVAWIDVRSRMILGDILCKDANSDILKQSLFKVLYHDAIGVPKYIYIDNGKDYTSQPMTGYNRKKRRKEKAERRKEYFPKFDDVTKGFYKSIGIEDDHEALPYQPWSKGEIERFFSTVCQKFSKWFSSYTGTLTGSKTSDKINKDIKKLMQEGKLLTIEEFYEKWHYWVTNVYAKKQHSSLKKLGEEWVTPKGLFENGERYQKATPPISYATMLMKRSDNVRVNQTGITRFGYEYRSDILFDYIGKKVNIKYDPWDITTLYVFDGDRQIGEVYAQELLQFDTSISEKTIEHLKRQKRQEARERKRLEDANMPFDQLNENLKGFNPVTGGINLMVEGTGKKSNVVAIPNDQTYKQNVSMRKQKEHEEIDDYLSQQAEEALRKLRAIN